MNFSVSCLLEYYIPAPVTFLVSVRAHEGFGQKCISELLDLPPGLDHRVQTCPATGTRFDRLHADAPGNYQFRYSAEVEVTLHRFPAGELHDPGPEAFDTSIFPYLYPSRYCQTDRFEHLVLDLFSHATDPESRVRSVVDWLCTHLSYVGGSTNVGTSAVDTMVDRIGVCRDYAHLGIAFCRAMNIPARYFTGYAHYIQPPDFHACFETWIGGRWLLWDATGLSSPDGLVRIASGRDASDCSICTSFGALTLLRQEVFCNAIDPNYRKMEHHHLQENSFSIAC